MLLKTVMSGARPEAADHPPLHARRLLEAYETFGAAAKTRALKVLMTAPR